MSAITIENDLVHYEVLGRGRPVIFVHGWLGSWRYWVPTMQQLSVKYRTYALDLWGFGDSGKEANRYGFKDQVQLLTEFMDKLGITKAALVGHSLGAAVCLRFASQHPDRAPRVALINPPLFDLGGLEDAAPITVNTPAVSAPAPAPAIPAATSATPAAAPAAPATPTTTPAAQPAAPAASGSTPVPPAAPAPATPVAPAQPNPADVPTTQETMVRNPLRGLGDSPEEILARLQAKNVQAAAGTQAAKPVLPTGIGTPIVPPPASPAAPATPAAPAQIPAEGAPATPPATPAANQPAQPAATPAQPPATPAPQTPAAAAPAPAAPTNPVTPATTTSPAPVPAAPTPAPAAPVAAMPGMPVRTDAPNPLLKYLNGKPVDLLTRYTTADAPDVDKLMAEVKKTDETALIKSAQSFNGINLSVELHRLSSPTLILHGKDDPVLPAPSDDLLNRINKGKAAGSLLAFVEPDVRHFPMLEISSKFNRLLMDFLEAADLTNVQFKDTWRRTLR